MSTISKKGEKSSTAPRSCQRCNQKKIHCDKAEPCEKCVKSNSECIFPGPGRAPRRKKRPLKAELVSRLRLLECEISGNSKEGGTSAPRAASSPATSHGFSGTGLTQDICTAYSQLGQLMPKDNYVTHEALLGLENQVCSIAGCILVILSNDFVHGKIGGLNDVAGASQNDFGDPDEYSVENEDNALNNDNQFIFGYSSMAQSLEELHPSVAHSQILWATFEKNVAPMVMIFHMPTLLKNIYKTATNRDHVDRPSEAIAFAVYFSAVNSMDSQTCEQELGQDYSSALQHYRFATQQALVRAGFFQLRDQTVLQAAVLFLTCLNSPKDAYFVWTMTAAVYRMAQGMGLHRDGSNFDLGLFEIEMRRRLWWAIYLLDTQSSEFHAIGPQITEDSYDTNFPLNINDEDISPESTQIQEAQTAFTEMTFCLVRIDMVVSHRRSALQSPGYEIRSNDSTKSRNDPKQVEQRLCQLEEIHNRLRERYLQFCDTSIPIQWVTATVIRLALARSWVIAHPSHGPMEDCMACTVLPSGDNQCQLFTTAIEVVDFVYLLETDPRTRRWSWLFERYPQWHSIIFVLTELCIRTQSAETDRAWVAIDKAVARWINNLCQDSAFPLKTVYYLMRRASAAHGRAWTIPTS